MDRRIMVFGLAAPALATLAACTTFDTTSYRPPSSLYFIDNLAPVFVERSYVDRYACRTGVPLTCECNSRVLRSSCRCRC
jgi:hypothetical protein